MGTHFRSWVLLTAIGLSGFTMAQNLVVEQQVVLRERVPAGRRFLRMLTGKKDVLYRPHGVVALGNGSMCVSDIVSGLLLVVDPVGEVKMQIGPDPNNRFGSPVGLCAGDRDNVYLVDSEQSNVYRVNVVDGTTDLLVQTETGRLTDITALQNNLWCTDTDRHRLVRFDKSGKWLQELGERGSGPGQFNYPTAITSDGTYLYVLDTMNFRVQVLTASGEVIRMVGSHGAGGGQFSKPKGIAVDQLGRLYVSDVSFDNVQVFDKMGRYLDHVGSSGDGPREFWNPAGMAVTKQGKILVVDTFNGRIQVLKVAGDLE